MSGSPVVSRAPETQSRIVLIADDDETTRIVLQRALSHAGFLALPVDDGGEIWPIVDRENVVALVLDLNMPGVNGWEVLRKLKDDSQYSDRHIRVVVLSGQSDVESRRFALSLGAAEFLSKPLDLNAVRLALMPALA